MRHTLSFPGIRRFVTKYREVQNCSLCLSVTQTLLLDMCCDTLLTRLRWSEISVQSFLHRRKMLFLRSRNDSVDCVWSSLVAILQSYVVQKKFCCLLFFSKKTKHNVLEKVELCNIIICCCFSKYTVVTNVVRGSRL